LKSNKLKIFNDPIYGFVTLPNELIFDLIQHPFFQRLRRISQMGLSYLVYPGAHHTRFQHAIGCMHLMQKAVSVLRFKGILISDDEENALYIAILLHDIGHGPFSHAMEHSIAEGISHEEISILFMQELDRQFDNKLSLAIKVFTGNYNRKFMLQLISSQLDMDRLDYLKRDSFYSGVEEGKINSDRIIQMMTVVDDKLVIEEKALYSVEKFLMSRRLMYWQVYFHKTSLVSELILTKILKRAKELSIRGIEIECSQNLKFFIESKVPLNQVANLQKFAQLDDYDIISALKIWQNHEDYVLSELSRMLINRDLLKIKIVSEKVSSKEVETLVNEFATKKNISASDAKYFVFNGKIKNQAYNKSAQPIDILNKNGSVQEIIEISEQLNVNVLTKPVTKFFMVMPKE
jgi:HD superfamily phosphohydrolase